MGLLFRVPLHQRRRPKGPDDWKTLLKPYRKIYLLAIAQEHILWSYDLLVAPNTLVKRRTDYPLTSISGTTS